MVAELVNDRGLRQRCRRLKRPPRKAGRGGCNGCGNKPKQGAIDVNELKRWMAEVIDDALRALIKKKFGTAVLDIRYRDKRGKVVSVQL